MVAEYGLIEGLICMGSQLRGLRWCTSQISSDQPEIWAATKKVRRGLRVITIIQKIEESIRRFEPLGEERQHAVLRNDGRVNGFNDQIVGQNALPNGCCA